MKNIPLLLFISFFFLFTACESEQVKMGRKAVHNCINSELKDGQIKGDTYTIIPNGNVYWEVEYHFWSKAPGTQIAFMHFMTNGSYAIDVNIKEYESKTGKKATKAKSTKKNY